VLLVALTGGIGSGKSTVAGLFGERGATVVDADAVSRRVVEPGQPALAALAVRFGTGILRDDGTLDRPALADLAFVDDDSRRALEAITHPAIVAEMDRRIATCSDDAVVVVEVQLLVETWEQRVREYDEVVLVVAPREVKLARLVDRGMTRDDAERRIRSISKRPGDSDGAHDATFGSDERLQGALAPVGHRHGQRGRRRDVRGPGSGASLPPPKGRRVDQSRTPARI
jgi:dephospho-CoA kinase